MELTSPDKFLKFEELDIIEAIERCFQKQSPKLNVIDGRTSTTIGIASSYSDEACNIVINLYEKKNWNKVTYQTSKNRGERPGITYFTFHF